MIAFFFLLGAALSQTDDAPAPAGMRIDIGGATLFIPSGFHPKGDAVNFVLHLHGAPRVLEPAFVESGWPAVLIEFNRKGLSSVYSEPFSDPRLFPALIDRALEAVKSAGLAQDPKAGKVVVSSFSAGFGGVRELLKVPEHFERISALVMADSLYAGYAPDPQP